MCSVRSSGPSRLQCLSRAAGNPEQWPRPRNEMPSCQLADLGPVQGALTDINECVLHEGAQDEAGIHVESIHEEVAADSCARSFVPRRFGADASKESSPVEVSQQGNYGVLEATQQPLRDKVIPHSTPLTLNWLSENYELAEGVCIPRNVIYKHYCDFCQKNGMMPVNPASFGKIIRQKFKMVKNRRLGTRGYSTYHYYGIGIRTYSVYYDQQYSRNGINVSMQGKRGSNNQVSSGSSTNHVPTKATPSTTTIPVLEFPNMQDVPLPSGVPHQLFHSFFTMYRAHCLRIFNSICRNELDEVQEFLQHFWKGVPLHLMGILGSNAVVNMVGVCDSILYRSIAGIFVPSTRKTSPVLLAMLKKLVPLIDGWFYTMLATLPANLCTVKRNLAHHFCRVLRRLISLHQIWLSVALLLQNSDSIARMLVDWRGTNVEQICSEVAFGMKWPETKHVMLSLFKEFEYLLENQVGLDILVQWFETVVDRCVTSAARERGCPVRRIARHFLLIWVTVGARVLRDLTLTSTHSFGSFHMLSLLANDYLAHCVELLEAEERTSEMMRNISLCSDTISPVSGKQSVPSATITTSQEILEYHEEAMLTSMPFPYQPNFSGSTRSSYDYICLTSPRQPNFSTKDIGHSSLMQEDRTEDCRYSQAKRYDFVDVASTPMICPTPCAYQGYQQYTLNTDCHSGRSTSLPPA